MIVFLVSCDGFQSERAPYRFTFLWILLLAAFSEIQRSYSNETFIAAAGPPEGFEVLINPWHTMVDIYYGDRHLVSMMATISPETITLSDPNLAVDKIPNISNKVMVLAALTGRLKNNADKVCLYSGEENCGWLKPKVAGVIFDDKSFRVRVFIAPEFLGKDGMNSRQYLPAASSNAPGLVQSLNVSVSGSNQGGSREVLYGTTSVGVGELSLASEWDVASGEGGRIASLYIERDFQGQDIRAGYFFTSGFGFSFTPDRPIVGVHASISDNTRTDLNSGRATPLDVYLPVRGRVDVFRDGILLRSWLLDAGSHQLNTDGFPLGAYTINVRVYGDGNQTISDESRFYVSHFGLAPEGVNLWFAEAGRLMSWSKRGLWPESADNWLARAGLSRRLRNSYGATVSAAASRYAALVEPGALYVGEAWELMPSVLISDHGDHGINVDIRLSMDKWLASLIYRKLRSKGNQSPDPVLFGRNSKSLYGTLSTQLWQGHLQYRFSQYSTDTVKGDNNHTLSYLKRLIQDNRYSIEGRCEVTKAGSDHRVLAGLDFRLRQSRINHTLSPKYERSRDQNSGWSGSGSTRYNLSYSDNREDRYNIQSSLWGEARSGEQLVGGNLRVRSRLGELTGAVDHNWEGSGSTSSWVMGLATSFTWTSGYFSIGGDYSGRSAVVVQIDGVDNHAVFSISVDGQKRGYTKGRAATVIPLEPYATYRIGIHGADLGIYDFLEEERQVTLYPGNVNLQSFNVQPAKVLFGQLLSIENTPIVGAVVRSGHERTVTDKSGIYQLEVPVDVKELEVDIFGALLQILPIPQPDKKSIGLKDVVNMGISVVSFPYRSRIIQTQKPALNEALSDFYQTAMMANVLVCIAASRTYPLLFRPCVYRLGMRRQG
ncbi:TcfC E-set like domain-containing protein [Parendozoicomonas sp. Alg238-R29]|uniref:TcfC E-set like domain-containing protein n=1 Tax=Parendozoicomonas sp. Alg238-R29 TaxID=2993446 RepID=UPI00248E051D|nr:TcfC E-set like domain-containing protein [Parendozoicomonas sp. Alg238-R29]